MSLIHYAKHNNLDYIIIAEDDNEFVVEENETDKIDEICNTAIKLLSENYGNIFNGTASLWDIMSDKKNSTKLEKYKTSEKNFVNLNWGQCTNFMICAKNTYDLVLEYPTLNNNELHIDQYFAMYFSTLTYIDEKFITKQRESLSDISGGYDTTFNDAIIKSENLIKISPYAMPITIGIYGIFIGKYEIFFDEFVENLTKLFVPNVKKIFFIVTDSERIVKESHKLCELYNIKIHIVNREYIGWPYETLYRFKYFMLFDKLDVDKCDYVFFINANARAVCPIAYNDVCEKDKITCVIHHGYVSQPYNKCPYEKNPLSTAYVDSTQHKKYIGGGFYGAETHIFYEICETLDKDITEDEQNSIIAIWHDESHMNKYVSSDCKYKIKYVDENYHVPSEMENCFKR